MNNNDLIRWLIDGKTFYWAVAIYLLIIVPLEMVIHELGHYFFMKQYGVHVRFFKIGIFNLMKFRHKNGTEFILGIPFLKAECRALGEAEDREAEQNNPKSLFYINRPPREIFFVALGGPFLALLVWSVLLIIYLGTINNAFLSYKGIICINFFLYGCNEFINLFFPLKIPLPILKKNAENIYAPLIFTAPNDAWMIYENLWKWIKKRKNP